MPWCYVRASHVRRSVGGNEGLPRIGGPLDHSHIGLAVGSSACTRWFTKPPKTYLEEGKRQKKTTQTTRREGRTTWGIGRVVLEAGDTHSLLHFSPSEMSLPKSTSTVYGAGFTVPCVGQKRDKCVKAWTIWLARCQSLQVGLAGFGIEQNTCGKPKAVTCMRGGAMPPR
jgi:hypothetical protein